MKRLMVAAAVLVAAFFAAGTASAHFQMLYTPDMALDKGDELTFKLVFTHPFADEHTMDMGTPDEFYVISEKKGKVDLKKYLKEITWTGAHNSGKAWEAVIPKKVVRSMGDYVFCLVPAPYYDKGEDAYMRQVTKMVMNVGGIPTIWSEPAGLRAEIVPLDKPYDRWVGNVFRGKVVGGDGKPVPNAEIEVEYMNHTPLMDKNAFAKDSKAEAPQDSFVTQTILADENGVFTYGLPKAGWWGFAAMGVGPDEKVGKYEFNCEAVIWVQAHDM